MDQTKFELLQPAIQVVSELYMMNSLRDERGQMFTITLLVRMSDGATAPLDIYASRIPDGRRNQAYQTIDGAKIIATEASIDPSMEAERFGIEIIFERMKKASGDRPTVRVSPKMIALLKERQERRGEEGVREIENFLRNVTEE